ncbi:MAG: tetratricopeptide repeat protein [Geminicoccaceae bacterium]|nr:tetratricopeptide repeat protein [Geminicoccaceae bacterium]
MQQDQWGHTLTTADPEAATLLDHALIRFLEYRADTAECIAACIARDAGFVMPRVLRAGLLLLMGSRSADPAIKTELEAIAGASGGLTRRETLHVDALELWARGDLTAASRRWEEIVVHWPHDLLALRSIHFQNFWMGQATYMRQVVSGALASWHEDMPGYGFLLGMAAFGLEECGDYARAERLGREAVERNDEDMWSIHAVAHVLEMQGRVDEGARWLDHAPDRWADRSPFKGHLWWHAGLFALERGDHDRALALYDDHIRPGERRISTDMMNAPSLLARLEFLGVDVGDRWAPLADWAAGWIDDHVIALTDAHVMFPLAREARPEAGSFIASLERFARCPEHYAASTAVPFLLPIARAIRAFYAGDPDTAVDLLLPLRERLHPIGGSHAQRDVFHQLLLQAALAAGRWRLARTLAMERTVLRPENALGWHMLARAFDGLGDAPAAAAARARAA